MSWKSEDCRLCMLRLLLHALPGEMHPDVLCCAMLWHAVLCHAVMCCAVLCCAVLCCAVLCCDVLPHAAFCCRGGCLFTKFSLFVCTSEVILVCRIL